MQQYIHKIRISSLKETYEDFPDNDGIFCPKLTFYRLWIDCNKNNKKEFRFTA